MYTGIGDVTLELRLGLGLGLVLELEIGLELRLELGLGSKYSAIRLIEVCVGSGIGLFMHNVIT